MTARSARHLAPAALLVLLPLAGCGGADRDTAQEPAPSASPPAPASPVDVSAELAALEEEFDAHLGVYAVDTGTGAEIAHNADDRFAYASTHKALSAGAILERNTLEEMEEVVTFTEDDLVGWTPVTEQHVDTGMTLLEVIDAAVRHSDNTAANLALEELGGPQGFEDALRGIGDEVIEAERWEPDLSEHTPGEERDTSTPRAMAASLEAYTLGDVLPEEKQDVLIDLLLRNTTGDATIRAGVPEGWTVGDKTGSANYGTRNNIALLWPAEGEEPIVLAIMSSRDEEDAERRDELIAETAGVVADALR
ncbi:beta-lactamase class A [Nocardiopsis flavescens]|uniref:Beta-lactamase n=1 Tax=Nocardiopsis flavescens TaxID=758803 RepID=A0A1M6BSI5_9ACTN|nr:class A beta-lactamase [Nocardiopsis flavescens]SHI51702.1 beta-lactamase class A [Nocardiopsis flavescens]